MDPVQIAREIGRQANATGSPARGHVTASGAHVWNDGTAYLVEVTNGGQSFGLYPIDGKGRRGDAIATAEADRGVTVVAEALLAYLRQP
ncbi:hypothetical protein BIV57_17940 [Mangrovactinospora gilvigrisea]|uniref:Uncharacterized protein n=1 Tax=Mangrovactinospora gilvigrisea TaxID=1428644 RepID=A0A1J7BBQ9_9ACTN|nr:hypothetical protein [Mangrovactinospora gilvigrisea]OIV36119.1 hypothetical protein BIV57_17940 [Mangrovactinospora gilvigrisea]